MRVFRYSHAPGEATGYELSSWINLPSGAITLHAGQSTTLNLTAQVPMNVSPGAHFGGVFITSQPPTLRANGSGIGLSVGGIMSLTVAGNDRRKCVAPGILNR